MKKKLLSVALAVIIAVTAITGASLAYLQDTDTEDNVFTVGNVEIDLYETFDEENAKLLPGVYDAENKVWNNAITKEVFVKNTGSEAAYVRVHIAIPQILDNGNPDFDAGKNVLHFNFNMDNVADGKWNWTTALGEEAAAGYSSDWNFYTAQIDGVWYNVYVVTYETSLQNGQATCDAMNQVYLDPKVTNEDITKIMAALPNGLHIYVLAEGVQAAGFNDAYQALNTAFGVPGNYSPNWAQAVAG